MSPKIVINILTRTGRRKDYFNILENSIEHNINGLAKIMVLNPRPQSWAFVLGLSPVPLSWASVLALCPGP